MHPERRHRAFTLVELMIAMTIIAVIGLTVVTVASALSGAQARTEAAGDAVHSARSGMMRIAAVLRSAKLLVGAEDGRLLCWMGDANGDGSINVDELVLIQHVPGQREIEQLRVIFPGASPHGLNVSETLSALTNLEHAHDLLNAPFLRSCSSTVVLSTDVQDFQVVTDVSPPFSELALLRMTTGPAGRQVRLTSAAGLRSSATGSVDLVDGQPVLNTE